MSWLYRHLGEAGLLGGGGAVTSQLQLRFRPSQAPLRYSLCRYRRSPRTLYGSGLAAPSFGKGAQKRLSGEACGAKRDRREEGQREGFWPHLPIPEASRRLRCSVQTKLVVMSASLSVDSFAVYFRSQQRTWQQSPSSEKRGEGALQEDSVMTLSVHGRTFPVSIHYLEDLAAAGDATIARLVKEAYGDNVSLGSVSRREEPAGGWVEQGEGLNDLAFTQNRGAFPRPPELRPLPQLARLAAAVVCHVHQTRPLDKRGGGAVLVFCSGVGEVQSVCRALEETQLNLWVLPCHGSQQAKQQQRVRAAAFERVV